MKLFFRTSVCFVVSLTVGFVISFISFWAFCFAADINPYYSSLGGGYYYSSDKEYGVDEIVYEPENIERGPCAISYHSSLTEFHVDTLDSSHRCGSVISCHVTEFSYDDNFILCERKPREKFDSLYHEYLMVDSNNRFDAYRNDYEAFKDGYNEKEYWVVCKKTVEVFGPLSFEEYQAYRQELNVPESLGLSVEGGGQPESIPFIVLLGLFLLFPALFAILITIWYYRYSRKDV